MPNTPNYAADNLNLASPKLGAEVVSASDDFFGAKERLISDAAPRFYPDRYDDHGQWMDGWESRRRRGLGHDHCLIRLGTHVRVKGFCIDTSHFTGNFPPAASVEAVSSSGVPTDAANWQALTDRVALAGNQENFVGAKNVEPVNWLRLNIFPDGGVARLRVFGEAHVDWTRFSASNVIELSSILSGGKIIDYSDAHYGRFWALLAPTRAENMGDGWETRRRRTPGNDWIIIQLGTPGMLDYVEIDTSFFKGNFPDRFSISAADLENADGAAIAAQSLYWPEMIAPTKLAADHVAKFEIPAAWRERKVSHLRLNIHPDGGVARFKAFGRVGTI